MSTQYTPGAVVTVGTLEVGDTIFLRQRANSPGLPVPTHPATVTSLVPFADGRVQVTVQPANSDSAPERLLGQLPATREFRSAVAAV